MIPHFLYHFFRDAALIRFNLRSAQDLRLSLKTEFEDLVLQTATKDDFLSCMALLAECDIYAVPWLQKVFKKRMNQLCSVAKDAEGRIVACDFYMFESSEQSEGVIHGIYLAVAAKYREKGLGSALRRFSLDCFDHGKLHGVSTLVPFDDIKALRCAQHCGFAITKSSAKPPAYYLFKALSFKK